VNLSKVVVTGDTMALHLAIAFEKDIITFYGPTPYQETDLLGLGKKFVRKELDCLSCHDQFLCPYDGKCMSLIRAESVLKEINKMLY
jgi:heptosyltransferase-2